MKTILAVLIFMGFSSAYAETVREPGVSGLWYAQEPAALKQQVQTYLQKNPPSQNVQNIAMMVVPHAGYRYSGPVAAQGYNMLAGRDIDNVLIIGVSHRYPLDGLSVCDVDAYRTPLGDIPVNRAWIDQMRQRLNHLPYDPKAHAEEHSVEAQWPFLQTVLPKGFQGVSVLVNQLSDQTYAQLEALISQALSDNFLVLISTDLSHYHAYDLAVQKDQKTMQLLKGNQAMELIKQMNSGFCEACGRAGLMAASLYAQKHGLAACYLHYQNSGDVTGDVSKGVVGYPLVVYSPKPPVSQIEYLNEQELEELLSISQRTLDMWLQYGEEYEPSVPQSPKLRAQGAAFVTINKQGRLRGCIGHLMPFEPLYLSVRNNTLSAAHRDQRFPPVELREQSDLSLKISVLTPMVPVQSYDQIVLGRDGLLLVKDGQRGVFLPEVPIEAGWDKLTFLRQLSAKAGFKDPDAWRDPQAQLFRFESQVFPEK